MENDEVLSHGRRGRVEPAGQCLDYHVTVIYCSVTGGGRGVFGRKECKTVVGVMVSGWGCGGQSAVIY